MNFIFPFDSSTFTVVHTALSLIALASGIVVILQMLNGRQTTALVPVYLISAVATSVTGFGFQTVHLMPSHVIGVLSLLALAAASLARYYARLAGRWSSVYTLGVTVSVYFLVFVAIAQAFMKIPVLESIGPGISKLPFAVSQSVALAIFVAAGIAAVRAVRRIRDLSDLV